MDRWAAPLGISSVIVHRNHDVALPHVHLPSSVRIVDLSRCRRLGRLKSVRPPICALATHTVRSMTRPVQCCQSPTSTTEWIPRTYERSNLALSIPARDAHDPRCGTPPP